LVSERKFTFQRWFCMHSTILWWEELEERQRLHLGQGLCTGALREPAEPLPFLPALAKPRPGPEVLARPRRFTETRGGPVGCGISQPAAAAGPAQTHGHAHAPGLSAPAAGVSDCGSGERWSPGEGKCSFSFPLLVPTAEGTASAIFFCPGPSFRSPVCLLWYGPW